MLSNIGQFIAGILILSVGGEFFIRGSSNTARIFGIKPLVVGLVITAFATSSPEFFVSFLATVRGSRELAVGNIVGSCICNIGMALGLAALIRPISINISILRRELPVLFIVTLGFFIICLDFRITRPEALILLVSFLGFIFYYVRSAKAESKNITEERPGKISRHKAFLYLLVGLAGLLFGANIMVGSSIRLASYFGISELVIGLTVVAIGTSLPELATTVAASIRGESDISIGNVIGSNIFNILGIIGIICLIRPVAIDPNITMISLPLLLLYTLALAPILKTGLKISRLEGGLLLMGYGVYLIFMLRQ
ncbi:MAG: calcium/sodium antiporter [Candidatus Omnitrophica bacterium]|nr:calcium/sodium antiporter [Candidatus Omnitrophota bacterium]